MKKHILTFLSLVLTTSIFAQKAQIWIGPNYGYVPNATSKRDYIRDYNTYSALSNGDTTYYRVKYQTTIFDSIKHTPKFGLSAGIRWEKPLKGHFGVAYGIGLNYIEFNRDASTTYGDFKILENVQIPKPVGFKPSTNATFNKIIFSTEKLKKGIDYQFIELQIPLATYWRKNEMTFSLGAQFCTPIFVRTTQEYFTYEKVDETTFKEIKKIGINEKSYQITRSSVDILGSYSYQFPKFKFEIAVIQKVTNLFSSNFSDQDFLFSNFGGQAAATVIKPITASVRFIYQLK
jgi:hypothetical protein